MVFHYFLDFFSSITTDANIFSYTITHWVSFFLNCLFKFFDYFYITSFFVLVLNRRLSILLVVDIFSQKSYSEDRDHSRFLEPSGKTNAREVLGISPKLFWYNFILFLLELRKYIINTEHLLKVFFGLSSCLKMNWLQSKDY